MKETNKENWLNLAKSDTPEYRKLAFEMITWLKDDIQEELFIWYHYNFNSKIQRTIFEFLNEDYQKRIKLTLLLDENSENELIPERLIIAEMTKSYVIDEKHDESNYLLLVRDYFFSSGSSLHEASSAIHILKAQKGQGYY